MTARKRTEAGDVVRASWGAMKRRPWLVLWVDDAREEACVVAITSKGDYCGAIPAGHAIYHNVGSWAMIQPTLMVNNAPVLGQIPRRDRDRIAAALHRNLALIGD